MTAYVYFITNGEAYKIGVSITPNKRLSRLQTANHLELKMHCAIEVETVELAYQLESLIHEILIDSHLRGEWFNCDASMVNAIVAMLQFNVVKVIVMHHKDIEAKLPPIRHVKKVYVRNSRYDDIPPNTEFVVYESLSDKAHYIRQALAMKPALKRMTSGRIAMHLFGQDTPTIRRTIQRVIKDMD